MNRMQELQDGYAEYGRLYDPKYTVFPFGTVPEGIGAIHVEFAPDGKISLISSDRNVFVCEVESYDVDEIIYYRFKTRAIAEGMEVAAEKRIAEGWDARKVDGRRIGFPIALDAIGRIGPEWRDRLEKEINEILKKEPYRGSEI